MAAEGKCNMLPKVRRNPSNNQCTSTGSDAKRNDRCCCWPNKNSIALDHSACKATKKAAVIGMPEPNSESSTLAWLSWMNRSKSNFEATVQASIHEHQMQIESTSTREGSQNCKAILASKGQQCCLVVQLGSAFSHSFRSW